MLSLTSKSFHSFTITNFIQNKQLITSRLLSSLIADHYPFGHKLFDDNHDPPLVMSKRHRLWKYKQWKRWPNDFLPFYWERQKKVPGFLVTGDLITNIGRWDSKALILDAEDSEQLKNAPEVVRKQFTLEYAKRKEIVAFQRHHIMKFMQRHPFDKYSHEARITNYTVTIRNLLEHFKKHPWAAREKTPQVKYIYKRAKLLTELYFMDYERYNFIKETLKIDHTPPVLGREPQRTERKKMLRKLTKEYCDKIINEKLEAYHQKLQSEQEQFLKEKANVEEWIATQEKFLGITANDEKK